MSDFHDLLDRLDDSFPVELIAQPIDICGHDLPLDSIVTRALEKKFDTAFIGRRRSDGSVWVDKVVTVANKTSRDVVPNDLVSGNTPLSSVIDLLSHKPFALVLTADRVTAVVTRSDLNLLPVRVMLFTLMTHAEMLLTEAISREYRGTTWMDALSLQQQEKIEQLQREKIKYRADTRLLDCASLGQKCEAASKTPGLRKLLGCPSRQQFRVERNKFVRLRNRLLHNERLTEHNETLPEDILRDALAHGDRLIVADDAVRALREVMAILRRWIDSLTRA